MKENSLISPYSVGALLYAPAIKENIAESIKNGKIPTPYSLALCLEDSIADTAVSMAEKQLYETLSAIYNHSLNNDFYIPKLFIRVRNPEQIYTLSALLGSFMDLISGFIAPKFTITNSKQYIDAIVKINSSSSKTLYLMPVLESIDLFNLDMRTSLLAHIKTDIDSIKQFILNIRVGGNDFCHHYGIRRHINETIYDIGPVNSILLDIITVFSHEYVVSAPVWEYFDTEGWNDGLINEIKKDKINGFIGKTVIHPNQISVVNKQFAVNKSDYDDAVNIINMQNNTDFLVSKSSNGSRMNEYKTHINWAKKIVELYNIYGAV